VRVVNLRAIGLYQRTFFVVVFAVTRMAAVSGGKRCSYDRRQSNTAKDKSFYKHFGAVLINYPQYNIKRGATAPGNPAYLL
jgi:hypothetical protein